MLGTENMQTLLSLCADVWVRLLPITSAAKKQLHCQTPVKSVVQVRHERFVLGNILPVPELKLPIQTARRSFEENGQNLPHLPF
jgi:hypothetical protein